MHIAEPIKPKNAKTVGSAISKFVGSLGYVGAVKVCGDNENVLVSGMEFFKQVRDRQGFSTTVTTNRNYSKDRTSICEPTIQTVRNLQKTLVNATGGINQVQDSTRTRSSLLGGNALHLALQQVSHSQYHKDHTIPSCEWTTLSQQNRLFWTGDIWT